jgi:pimeloyl-ACP methyl ester carboxylesterase
MVKPTIMCVPGAWHSPEVYSEVFKILEGYGYPTVGLPLPSVGATPPHTDFHEDVQAIRDCLTKLIVEEEKEVILVTHSYTGMPGAEAPIGLGKKEREEKGLQGGLTRLVFIMTFAMPEGFQPTAGGAQYPEWMKVDVDVRYSSATLITARYNTYCPP